ncbi:MAG: 3-phosphoshikimate 1-carboxyvinyltransferase [Micrococcales bacterium]|nr:3-phosphoshikimate 1-carboxyvinyltransferase [Micrococcales bacterium]
MTEPAAVSSADLQQANGHSVWPAPLATGPLSARVAVPGSKSLTARYLVLGSLAQGQSHLTGVPCSRDTSLMINALSSLGACLDSGSGSLDLDLCPIPRLKSQPQERHAPLGLDVGLAGTVMRFIPPVAASLCPTQVHFDGDPAARARPMAPLLDALERLGANVIYHQHHGHLPFTIKGPLHGSQVSLDSHASSQFASALLLVAPALPSGLELELNPPALPSRPHLEMSIQALTDFGARIQTISEHHWMVQPGGLTGQKRAIEPDLSNAAPFLAAALVAGGQVTISHWPNRTTQPGMLLVDYLQQMGATANYNPQTEELTVTGSGQIRAVDLDLSPAGELTPTLAALAALADGPSRLTGIGHLEGHETNRLAALVNEINRLGGQARQIPDGLEITPRPLRATQLATYGDHRMATFGAIIGLKVPGVGVENISTTAKTLPGFADLWLDMLAGIDA